MPSRNHIHEVVECERCGEENFVDIEVPEETQGNISVYGDIVIKEYNDTVTLSKNDWEKIRPMIKEIKCRSIA